MENATSSDTLKRLLDLQRVDTAIDRLMQRKADLPEQRTVDELNAQLAEAQAAHAEKKAGLDEIAHEQSRLEADVQMIDDKITQESNRLYGGDITSPKELASIQAELDALRRRKNHLEDQDLEVMERREAVENDVTLLDAQLEELRAKLQAATEARDHAAVEIETELNKNSASRTELVPQIPQDLLDTYEELRPKKGGVAAAALEGNVCRGCGVALSPMALDDFKRAEEGELARCENCRRILVRL